MLGKKESLIRDKIKISVKNVDVTFTPSGHYTMPPSKMYKPSI